MNESSILAIPRQIVTPSLPTAVKGWQALLKSAIRDPQELCRLLDLSPEYEAAAVRVAGRFGLFAPRGYVALMQPGDPLDPLLRQVLPLAEESLDAPGFEDDPVGDRAAARQPGLLQKYAGRALLIATGACAIHCRYCFRRHYPYDAGPRSAHEWAGPLAEIAADRSLHEVILSGGDPLTLLDDRLSWLASRLEGIPHLRRLRIHTRLPIVLPERVCDELLQWLRGTRLTTLVVIHANHPRELSPAVAAALGRLVDAGVPLLNQAVLLRGVNDQLDVQVELCERLADLRVIPYYLHQLDRVRGAAHFEVPEAEGLRLVSQLRARLPGYATPRYVRESPGELSKSVLT